MSTVHADNYGNRVGSASIPVSTLLQGTAKAWLNLNGTNTIATRDSFNVSSVIDNGAGDYSTNFAVAQPNAGYCSLVTVCRGWGVITHSEFMHNVTASQFRSSVAFTNNGGVVALGNTDTERYNFHATGDPV